MTWLANYLLEHNPNKPRIVMPEHLQLSSADGCADDDDDFAPYIAAEAAAEAELNAAATRIQSTVRGRQTRAATAQRRAAAAAAREAAREAAALAPGCVEAAPCKSRVPPVADPLPERVAAPLAAEVTLAMIKPDAVAAGCADQICAEIEAAGFTILHRNQRRMDQAAVVQFYGEHVGKPFFPTLARFMTSGPVWALALRKEGAIGAWRSLMGPTNSTRAADEAPQSLRARFGTGEKFQGAGGQGLGGSGCDEFGDCPSPAHLSP